MGALLPSQVLDKAADLIEPEGAWTQGHGARTAAGRPTGPTDEDAQCWCLFGAICRIDGNDADEADISRFVQRALRTDGDISRMFDWNDSDDRTQAEVVSALRKAAELARSEGQ
jgi:hypothetical protein